MIDLLCEGKYAELMVEHPETSSDIVTWVRVSSAGVNHYATAPPLATPLEWVERGSQLMAQWCV